MRINTAEGERINHRLFQLALRPDNPDFDTAHRRVLEIIRHVERIQNNGRPANLGLIVGCMSYFIQNNWSGDYPTLAQINSELKKLG